MAVTGHEYAEYIRQLNERIQEPDREAATLAKNRWDSIAKPLSSLGMLEEDIIRIAALTGSANVDIPKRAVAMFCSDNGVVAQGVTQTGSEVTAIVAANAAKGKSSVCNMARAVNADVFPIDVGMLHRAEGVCDRHVANGTRDITIEPAMTMEQAKKAINTGIDTVNRLKKGGYKLIVTGEMGIGNTTTAAAVTAVLTGLPVNAAVGRGAGLSDEGLIKKRNAIIKAISLNRPDPENALDVLSKLGGFDMAAMAGAFIGGAIYRTPVIIDGFISSAAALIAKRMCPASVNAMLASHSSAEPAAKRISEELGLEPIIYANMRLGEGTGGVCLIPMLDMALNVYNSMATFDDIEITPYTPQGGNIK